jgi:hypothetical protein
MPVAIGSLTDLSGLFLLQDQLVDALHGKWPEPVQRCL